MSTAFAHIVCCIDSSDAAATALDHASALRELVGGRLTVLHVVAPPPFLVSFAATLGGAPVHDDIAEREAAEMWLEETASNVPGGAEAVLLEGSPGETACDWAAEAEADVMVAASHRGAVERMMLGSFANYLTHHAPCPLLLIPPARGAHGS